MRHHQSAEKHRREQGRANAQTNRSAPNPAPESPTGGEDHDRQSRQRASRATPRLNAQRQQNRAQKRPEEVRRMTAEATSRSHQQKPPAEATTPRSRRGAPRHHLDNRPGPEEPPNLPAAPAPPTTYPVPYPTESPSIPKIPVFFTRAVFSADLKSRHNDVRAPNKWRRRRFFSAPRISP